MAGKATLRNRRARAMARRIGSNRREFGFARLPPRQTVPTVWMTWPRAADSRGVKRASPRQTKADRPALGEQARARRRGGSPVDTAAAEQRGVCRVDDRVDREPRDVAALQADARLHSAEANQSRRFGGSASWRSIGATTPKRDRHQRADPG